MLYELIGIKSI